MGHKLASVHHQHTNSDEYCIPTAMSTAARPRLNATIRNKPKPTRLSATALRRTPSAGGHGTMIPVTPRAALRLQRRLAARVPLKNRPRRDGLWPGSQQQAFFGSVERSGTQDVRPFLHRLATHEVWCRYRKLYPWFTGSFGIVTQTAIQKPRYTVLRLELALNLFHERC